MDAIKRILRTPSASVLFLVAVISFIGVIIKGETDKAIARMPIDATATAEARLTEIANFARMTRSAISPTLTWTPSPATLTPTTAATVMNRLITEQPPVISITPTRTATTSSPIAVEVTQIAYYQAQIRSLAWFPNSKQLVMAGFDLQPYDIASQKAFRPTDIHILDSVAIAPEGNTIAAGNWMDGIYLWDTNWAQLNLLPMSNPPQGLAFTPDSKSVVAGIGHAVKFWDIATGQEALLIPFSDRVDAVAISPNGQTLAISLNTTIKVLDTSGKELFTLTGHGHQIPALAFSPDGNILASGSLDKTIRLWDMARGIQLGILSGHANTINSVAFSPDGRLLASGSDDTTAKVWDVINKTELRTLYNHTDPVYCVAFSPDGTMLATGSYDKLQLWRITYKTP